MMGVVGRRGGISSPHVSMGVVVARMMGPRSHYVHLQHSPVESGLRGQLCPVVDCVREGVRQSLPSSIVLLPGLLGQSISLLLVLSLHLLPVLDVELTQFLLLLDSFLR